MDNEPRKASEVLVELESKIDQLLGIVKSQDLQMKVISNKLKEMLDAKQSQPPKIMVEAINTVPVNAAHPQNEMQLDPERNILISPENKLPMEEKPSGFRRTSRPETFTNDKQKNQFTMKPSQEAEIIVNSQPTTTKQLQPDNKQSIQQNTIPVMQRIVDNKGKSVFLADVNIVDLSTNQSIFKTRTNGTGKWVASLPMGAYHITINKMESLTKSKIEAAQDVKIDGNTSPLSLPMMIIK